MVDQGFAGRMMYALLDYQRRVGRKVSQLEVGTSAAKLLDRGDVASAVVSRHFTGKREMDLVELAAYASVLGVDPGWLGFGEKSKAPAPEGWRPPLQATSGEIERAAGFRKRLPKPVLVDQKKKAEKGKGTTKKRDAS